MKNMDFNDKDQTHEALSQTEYSHETLNKHYRPQILKTIAYVGSLISFIYAILIWTLYSNAFSAASDAFYGAMYLCTLVFVKNEPVNERQSTGHMK